MLGRMETDQKQTLGPPVWAVIELILTVYSSVAEFDLLIGQ